MSLFEQSIAEFLKGKATPDDLRTSLELMAPLDDDDVKFVFATLNNLAATGHFDPKVHKELLNTAITATTRTGALDQASETPQPSGEPSIVSETLFNPESTNASYDISNENQSQVPITPAIQGNTYDGHGRVDSGQSKFPSSRPPFDSGFRQGSRYDSVANSLGFSDWTASELTGTNKQAPSEGTVIKGRFVLEQKIASGGMGVVFKARDLVKEEAQERNPYVALKVLNEAFKKHPASLKALSREARKTQHLAHPNIVNVFDFDRDHDTVFMTMEFLKGKGLDQVLLENDGNGLPVVQALDYISQMGRALIHAHSKGVLHCDFKPNNVFLLNDGTVKVLDFGIARANRQSKEEPVEHTRFDAKDLKAMTVGYASREIHEGVHPETSDDVFALACVSYELLTGKHPYDNKAANTLLEGPEKLKLPPGLKRNQWKALQRGLAIQRSNRTSTVGEFIGALNPDGKITVNSKQIAAFISAISIIGLMFYIPGQLQRNQMARLAIALSSPDSTVAMEAIQSIESLDISEQESLSSSVQSGVIDFLNTQAQLAEDPAEAEEFLQRGLQLFPTSSTLFTTLQDIETRKNQRISDLNADFTYALESNQITADSWLGSIEELLNSVELEDPQSPLLTDRRLVLRIQQQAQLAVQSRDFDSAMSLVNFGLQRFPIERGLLDMPDIIEQARGNFIATAETDRRATATNGQDRDQLDELIGNPEFTTAWDNEINQLRTSLLVNRVLSGDEFENISEQVGELYANETSSAINSGNFTEAFRLINAGKSYAPELDWSRQESLLADAQTENLRIAEIEGLKYTFQTQLSAMQLSSARESLENLQELEIDVTDPFISQAYIDLAGRAETNGSLQEALGYSNEGLAFLPDSTELAGQQKSLRLQIARQAIYTYFVEQAETGNEENTRLLLAEASALAPIPSDHDDFISSMGTDLSETLTKLEQSEAVVWLANIKNLLPQLGDSLDSFAAPGPEQRIETLVSTAQSYLNQGTINSAIENYQLAMAIDPSHLMVRELLVEISDTISSEADELYDDAQYEEAINLIDIGIALEPSNMRSLERLKEDSQAKLEAPRRRPRAIGF